MARKAKTPTTIDQTEVDEEVQTAISDTVNTVSAHSEKILTTYGDGEQFFDLHLSELKAREAMERGARAMIDAGRHLIVIKEHCEHGDWLTSLERIGVHPRTAQRMMQAAVKFLSSPGSRKLLEATTHKTKLLELMTLDDDELEQLGEGGTVGDIELDELERMTCSELKKKIRELRADKEALSKHDAAQAEELRKLKIETGRAVSRDDEIVELRATASQPADEAESLIRTTLVDVFQRVLQHGTVNEGSPLTDNSQYAWLENRLDLLDEAVLYLRSVIGIERTVPDVPEWADPEFDAEPDTATSQ